MEAVASLRNWPAIINDFDVRLDLDVCQGHFEIFLRSSRAMASLNLEHPDQPKQ